MVTSLPLVKTLAFGLLRARRRSSVFVRVVPIWHERVTDMACHRTFCYDDELCPVCLRQTRGPFAWGRDVCVESHTSYLTARELSWVKTVTDIETVRNNNITILSESGRDEFRKRKAMCAMIQKCDKELCVREARRLRAEISAMKKRVRQIAPRRRY